MSFPTCYAFVPVLGHADGNCSLGEGLFVPCLPPLTRLLSMVCTQAQHTVNSALLASSFVWQIQLSSLHISLFKVIKKNFQPRQM
jgi:hypothetical protein